MVSNEKRPTSPTHWVFHLYPGAAGPHFLFGLVTGKPTIHHKQNNAMRQNRLIDPKKDITEKR